MAELAPLVELRQVAKRFGPIAAVVDVSLTIQPGEFFALLGPSGCGKTTLMRMLAGFEAPDAGEIRIDGRDLAGVAAHRRPVNIMFQSHALFPHMNVWNNIAFGLRQEATPRAELARRVEEALALVRLEDLARRKPHQLSGGQQQRVALARAIVKRPKIVLLDEPLAALDRKLREATQAELKRLQRALGLAFLIVTHDQAEAMALADRIAVMDRGRVLQIGPPGAIYEAPASRKVASFVGEVNLIEGVVAAAADGGVDVTTSLGRLRQRGGGLSPGQNVAVALRPEKVSLCADEPTQAENRWRGKIASQHYLGDSTAYVVRLDGGDEIKVLSQNRERLGARPADGDDAWISWSADAAVLLTQ